MISKKKIICLIYILNFANSLYCKSKSFTDIATDNLEVKKLKYQHSMYGNYPINRDITGTHWVPDSSPYQGYYKPIKDWLFLFAGGNGVVCDIQRGKRGEQKLVDQNQLFFTAQRDVGCGTIAFRSIFSIEGLTIGKCGMPSLLQSRFDCDCKPIIDRQRPSTLFREFAVTYSHLLKEHSSAFIYLSLIGLPCFGAPPSPDRYSGWFIPEYPIRSHWFGAFNVLTTGLIHKNVKWEFSAFRGREPNVDQWFKIQKLKFDSYAFRVSVNPNENLAFQASYAFVHSPNSFAPEVDAKDYSISAIYNRDYGDVYYQAAAVFGIIDDQPGNFLPAVLLEGTLTSKKNIFFARFESTREDTLFIESDPLANKAVWVNKLSLAYIYSPVTFNHIKWTMGALLDIPILPSKVHKRYGDAVSFMLFTQLVLVTD